MEGPTPVSALIHAATMVTAGILLLFRISSILTTLPYILLTILVLGSCTAVLSGFVASYQTDLKKIIAYSTCSQLGYMFFSCGLTMYSASLFHLLSHGFFKALLFLVAGSIIHMHLNEQVLSKLFVFENIKITSLLTLSLYIGFVALTALPFFSGFYSKEPLLVTGGSFFNSNAWLSGAIGYNFGIFAAVLTALYSASAFEDITVANPKRVRSNNVHRLLPLSNKVSLTILSIFSLFFGFFGHESLSVAFQKYFKTQNSIQLTLSPLSETVSVNFSQISQSLPLIFEILPLILSLLFTGIPRMSFQRLYRKNISFYSAFYSVRINGLIQKFVTKCLSFFQVWAQNKF